MFWEREPFVWDDEQGRVSRFISLGAFGGDPLPERNNEYACQNLSHISFIQFRCCQISGSMAFLFLLPLQHPLLFPA